MAGALKPMRRSVWAGFRLYYPEKNEVIGRRVDPLIAQATRAPTDGGEGRPAPWT
jgi:hypothetical protein